VNRKKSKLISIGDLLV